MTHIDEKYSILPGKKFSSMIYREHSTAANANACGRTDGGAPITGTPRTAALREPIDALAGWLDRIEAQATQPSALDSAQARLTGSWDALLDSGRIRQRPQPQRSARTCCGRC